MKGTFPTAANSYFVWFRLDNQNLQFYKTINDAFSLVHEVPFTTVPGQEYRYRVIYSRVTGTIDVYVNGAYVASWTDPTPYQGGQYISFRSGNSRYVVNDLRVYRLRGANALITVGNSGAMIRYQDPNPQTPAGRILSLVTNVWGDFSAVEDSLLDVDWTPPVPGPYISDGFALDEDTLSGNGGLGANWAVFSDPNSGLSRYSYAVGQQPGSEDIVSWTNNELSDNCSFPSWGIQAGTNYYVSVYAKNSAGLVSDTVSSDGFVFFPDAGLETGNGALLVYPNPTRGSLSVSVPVTGDILYVYGVDGKLFHSQQVVQSSFIVSLGHLPDGIYLMRIGKYSLRFVKAAE